ncbi:MAG: Eco57I restriction-modification methylase domain-containing protein, partial [Huintestinicola sp.]
NSEQLLKQQQILDSEINSDETIREKNLEALNSIKIGDEITLKGETFVVKSINGSFMMSMDNVKALSGEFIGEASRQFIGNWQNQLADEAGDSLIGISKPDISNTLNNEVQLEETVDNSHSWDVRVSRALNVIDGISTHISESSKKNEHSYVYGTYQSYEEASRALATLRKEIENNAEFSTELYAKCPYFERDITQNMEITLDGERYSVLDFDRLANTVDLIKSDDRDVSMPYNKLHDIISEINAYVSGEEITRESSAEEQNNEEKQTRFRITDEHIGEGGKKEKFRNNVEAIKTLQLLEKEERLPTAEEQEKLSKYIGWGGLQEAFDDREPSWNAEYYELKNLLTEDEYEAARATVKDAFFTSPVIINAIYETLANMGFEGGEILEPSMGVGNFFGAMPDNIRDNSNLSGVELDSISGRIAKKLYPEADIAINGFEKVKFNKGTFDLAIGNVPFGNYSLNDKSNKDYKSLMIHDYFFAKSVDSVRPGGIVAFVTSTGTLDKEDTKVRQMLAQKAELLGAIRLPDNAFQKNAGTQTATDIIFLKKRDKELKISDMPMDKSCDWIYTKESTDGFTINSYFVDNPDMILGTLAKGNFDKTTCKANSGADLKEQLSEAIKNIKGEYTPLEFQPELDEKATDEYLNATPDIENLTYTVINDKLYYRVDDDLIPLKESEQHGKTAERRKAMCDLAVSVRELLQAQVENRSDDEIKKLQDELNKKYDKFVIKYDRINPIEVPNANTKSGVSRKAPNSNAFKNDVRLPLLTYGQNMVSIIRPLVVKLLCRATAHL